MVGKGFEFHDSGRPAANGAVIPVVTCELRRVSTVLGVRNAGPREVSAVDAMGNSFVLERF